MVAFKTERSRWHVRIVSSEMSTVPSPGNPIEVHSIIQLHNQRCPDFTIMSLRLFQFKYKAQKIRNCYVFSKWIKISWSCFLLQSNTIGSRTVKSSYRLREHINFDNNLLDKIITKWEPTLRSVQNFIKIINLLRILTKKLYQGSVRA